VAEATIGALALIGAPTPPYVVVPPIGREAQQLASVL